MRIFTKKAFAFKNPETGKEVVTRPLEFCEVPDWVAKDKMFAWAQDDGDITVTETEKKLTKAEQAKAAKEALTKEFTERFAAAQTSEEAAEIIAEAEKAGIKLTPQE